MLHFHKLPGSSRLAAQMHLVVMHPGCSPFLLPVLPGVGDRLVHGSIPCVCRGACWRGFRAYGINDSQSSDSVTKWRRLVKYNSPSFGSQ